MRPVSDALETVRRFREALQADDDDRANEILADDVEWVELRRTLHGRQAVADAFVRAESSAGPENLDVELETGELEDLCDGRVGTFNRQVFRWKGSGDVAYQRLARIEYTVRDGQIARYELRVVED